LRTRRAQRGAIEEANMTTRHSEAKPNEAARESADRRDRGKKRVPFEALVEVGAEATGGFEAESVDVSVHGIRLRTAYMPRPGETLVCRFDGVGGEVVAEGQVMWCQAQERGGEFGVNFTGLDEHGAQLLQGMCGPIEVAKPDDAALIGSRVRLHINGLGSPMRARVRDSLSDEVLVGSNLEFLRVGREVELEDIEAGGRRGAMIEHVTVDVDPETHVPQLVVALRYEGALVDEQESAPALPAAAPPAESIDSDDYTTAPFRVRSAAVETTPEPTVIDSSDEEETHARPSLAIDGVPRVSDPAPATLATGTGPDTAAPSAGHEVRDRVGQIARTIGPKLTSAGAGAKSALGGLMDTVRRKREQRVKRREEQVRASTPKRTTAPPPSGALRSDGKRLFRSQHAPAEERSSAPPTAVTPPRSDKKRAVFGAVLGLAAVVAIYVGATQLSEHFGSDGAPAAAAAAPAEQVAAQPQQLPAAAQLPVPKPGGAAPNANVPLFGPTPMSTTEAVPVPPAPGEAKGAGEPAVDSGSDGGKAKKAANLEREWGVGSVSNPTSIRLKMDGNLDGLRGTEDAMGFTITVPGRKSVSSAAGLTRKDKRLDSINVVNYPDRAEITVRFKRDVPAFIAKARGKRLIIELSDPKASKKKRKKKSSKKRRSKKKKR
jgi:hypothetical protein